jgi:tape measure domain-containing protein
MRFDNSHFEKNVATTMSTLDKLKQKLNLKGAADSLNGLSTSAKKVDLSSIGTAAEKVGVKFSAMYTIADQALRRITDSALHAGKKIADALTVDPIKTGLSEYETKMNAIQVIQANTRGKNSMGDITAALDDLNTYADKTIYNFAQMTSNIGKFTAQGYDVYEAANAVKGLANLAAASGASAEDMARATYQMSQALGGTIKLMDWNSLRNANMATQDLKNTLIDLAKVNGIAIDDMIKKHGTFEQTLQEGWLSGQMFTEAMNIYSGIYSETELKAKGFTDSQVANFMDLAKMAASAATEVKTVTQLWDVLKETAQSGWTQTWELIIGDFDTAKKMFTDLQVYFSDIINGWSDARNELLKGWADLGGRAAMIESFKNVWSGLLSVIKPIKMAFREIFPSMSAKQLFEITDKIRELTEGFKLTGEQSKKLRLTFKGLFAVVDIGITYAKNLIVGLVDIVRNFSGFGDVVLNTTSSIGKWLISLRDSAKESDAFGKAVRTVTGFIGNFIADVKNVATILANSFVTTGLESVLGVLSGIGDVIDSIVGGLSDMIDSLGVAVAGAIRTGDVKAVMDIFNAGIFTTVLVSLKKFTGGLGESLNTVTESVTGMLNCFKDITAIPGQIGGILDEVKDTLVAYQNEIKARTLLTIAGAIAILAAAVTAIALIDADKLSDSLGAISVLFVELIGSMAVFGRLPTAVKGVLKSAAIMITMSIAVGILAAALKAVASVDSDKLFSSVIGVGALCAILVTVAKQMSKGGPTLIKGAGQMVIFAAAVVVLAHACKQLAELEWGPLIRGLVGVGVLLAEIAGFLKIAKFDGKTTSTAVGIVILSGAILILGKAVAQFGALPAAQALQGVAAVGLILAALAAFTKVTANAKNVIATGTSLILIGAAMKIFASAVADFGGMPFKELALGLIGMGSALAIVAIAMKQMPANVVSIGAGLVIVSAALVILAEALARMGSMSVEQIIHSIAALAGSITILARGLKAMNGTLAGSAALAVAAASLVVLAKALTNLGGMSGDQMLVSIGTLGSAIVILAYGLKAMVGTLTGSQAMLVAAAAMAVMAVSLKLLGSMSIVQVGIALLGLAGAFAIFGVAGMLLAPLVPVLQGLGVAVILFGAGCLAAGVGIAALGTGLVMLTNGGVQAIDMILKAVNGVVDLIPKVGEKVAQGIVNFAKIISEGAPALGQALIALVKTAVDVLTTCAPDIAEGTFKLILKALEMFTMYAPQIVDFLVEFVIKMIDSLASHIPTFIQSAMNLIGAFFQGVVDALRGIDMKTMIDAIAGVGLLTALLYALSSVVALLPSAMVGVLGLGVFIAELALVLAAIGALSKIPGLEWLIGEGGDLLEKIGTAIGQFVGGIIGGVAKGATSALPDIGKDLSNFIKSAQPFIDGARKIDASVMEGVKSLAEVVLILTAADILNGLTSWFTGGSSLCDFGKELSKFGPYFKKYSDSVSGVNASVVTASAHAAKSLSELAANLPNSGGIVSWFTGDNDLSAFGASLVPFGKSMKKYSDSVIGINPAVVTASANSAMALSELASKLPNSGGIVSWFTGDNDLASFGMSLVSFGKNFADYADHMEGVDSSVLMATTAAAGSIVELQKSLPKDGGWFSDDMTLADFGKDLSGFGKKFSAYYNSISSVDAGQMGSVTSQINRLVSMMRGMNGLDVSGTGAFVTGLQTLAQNGIDGFITAFTNANSRATTAVTNFINASVTGITNKKAQFNSAGQLMMTSLLTGIKSRDSAVSSAVTNIVSGALIRVTTKAPEFMTAGRTLITSLSNGMTSTSITAATAISMIIDGTLIRIKTKALEFNSTGKALMTNFVAGIRSRESNVSSAFANTTAAGLTKVRDYYSSFYSAGGYLVDGFAAGISANTFKAEAKAAAMARKAYEAAKKELDVNSPSKVFIPLGSAVVEGFALGIDENIGYATSSASDMTNSTVDIVKNSISRIADAIDSGIDTQPTIRPVLDLSNVEVGASRLNTMFSRSQALSVRASMDRASAPIASDTTSAPTSGSTFQFTQINNSPKALSRTEIYRQTSNQFSAFERMVKA